MQIWATVRALFTLNHTAEALCIYLCTMLVGLTLYLALFILFMIVSGKGHEESVQTREQTDRTEPEPFVRPLCLSQL